MVRDGDPLPAWRTLGADGREAPRGDLFRIGESRAKIDASIALRMARLCRRRDAVASGPAAAH